MATRLHDLAAGIPDIPDGYAPSQAQIELDYGIPSAGAPSCSVPEGDVVRWAVGSGLPEYTRAQVIDEVLKARDQERQRIGQELHDSAGQLLVSLQLSVAHLGDVGETLAHERVIEEIHETVRQIDREIRSLAFLNYPAEMRQRTLPAALEMLARGFAKRTGFQLRFKASGDASVADASTSAALLRVAQEALVNIYRHSGASSVGISLKIAEERIDLTISDNGVGLPVGQEWEKTLGVGLKGMRHRVEQLRGQFRIRKSKKGTIVSASVPLTAY